MIDQREIERLGARLGRDAGERIDSDRVAAKVVARLRASRRPWLVGTRSFVVFARAAAVVGLLIVGGLVVRARLQPGAEDLGSVAAPLALGDLSADELTDVLDTLLFEAPVSQVALGGLEDLTNTELRELLTLLEG